MMLAAIKRYFSCLEKIEGRPQHPVVGLSRIKVMISSMYLDLKLQMTIHGAVRQGWNLHLQMKDQIMTFTIHKIELP